MAAIGRRATAVSVAGEPLWSCPSDSASYAGSLLRRPTHVTTAVIRSRGMNGLYRQPAAPNAARTPRTIRSGPRQSRNFRGAMAIIGTAGATSRSAFTASEPFEPRDDDIDDHGVELR